MSFNARDDKLLPPSICAASSGDRGGGGGSKRLPAFARRISRSFALDNSGSGQSKDGDHHHHHHQHQDCIKCAAPASAIQLFPQSLDIIRNNVILLEINAAQLRSRLLLTFVQKQFLILCLLCWLPLND
ncbi:hypothetical protein CHUAL_001407 [Chamberlinius hualienensis]